MHPRIKRVLDGIVASDRVAGAYIFSGPPGAGKSEAAKEFAAQLGCKAQDKIFLEPDGASLKIEQIRDLQGWVRFGPSAGKYLAAVIFGADTLTGEAAAAFLKTLEEPAAGVVFILLAEREDRLPETILSRCQRIIFPEGSREWQIDSGKQAFYDLLAGLEKVSMPEIFGFSSMLEKEKERIEELLYDLAFYARYRMADVRCVRIILESLYWIKRRTNLKLALDVMCLRLANAG